MTTSLGRRSAVTALLAGVLATPLLTSYDADARAEPDRAEPPATRSATAFPVSGLPTGARPRIAFARATKPEFLGGNYRLHRPDGSSLRLGYLALGQWVPMGRGAFGIAATEAGPQLQRIDAGGTIVRKRFLHHVGLVVSPDHRIVSWLDDRNRPRDLEGGGTRELTLPRVPEGDSVGAVWGSRTCREQAPEGGGCTVFVNTAHNRGVFVSTSHGIVARAGTVLHVTDVSQGGRVLGLVTRRTATRPACWGLYRPDGHRAWQTCRYRLTSFSPDGRRVLGVRQTSTGDSTKAFAIFRRDGSLVRAYTFDTGGTGTRRILFQLTWENPKHLLAILKARGAWSIVRVGVGGLVEYAVPPRPAVNEFYPYTLPLR